MVQQPSGETSLAWVTKDTVELLLPSSDSSDMVDTSNIVELVLPSSGVTSAAHPAHKILDNAVVIYNVHYKIF